MAMKFKIAKLDEVAEGVRSMYRPEGDAFVLDVDGVVPKERLDEFRDNNIQLQKQLEKLKDVDPVKYKELVELQRQVDEGKLLKEGKIEEVVQGRVAQMRTSLEGERDTFKTRAERAENQLSTLLIDAAVKGEALKLGVLPTALDDVVLRARGTYRMVDGIATPHDEKGQVVYGKDGKTPMAMGDWVEGLKKSAPHLFAGSQGGGAGGGARTGNVDLSKASPVQKIGLGLANSQVMGSLPGA